MRVRESNYELMRIISMMFIIIYHSISYGGLLGHTYNVHMQALLHLVRFIVSVHVNSFVLLTGYFQSNSKFKFSKLLKLIMQSLFYVLVINLVLYKLGCISDVSRFNLLIDVLPSSIGQYWFIATYIILYILSDYINKIIDKLSRSEYKNLLILLFVTLSVLPFVSGYKLLTNNGFNIYHFVFLYLIGGYLRKFPLRETYHFKRFTNGGYFFLMIFMFFLMSFISFSLYIISRETTNFQLIDWLITRINDVKYGYATPYVVIQSICYFEIFSLFKFKSKIINYLSSCTFGIYLFHEHQYIRPVLYVWLGVDKGPFTAGFFVFKDILIASIIIFVFGVIIDSVRKLLFMLLSKTKTIKYLSKNMKKIITGLSFNIEW